MITPIPPFILNAARVDGDEDGGADNEYDFVEELESGLEKDLEPDDFAGQFEEELEKELLSGVALADTSLFDLPTHLLNNDNLDLHGLDKDYDIITTNTQSKRVRGKCRDGYELGNFFQSCWYQKFLAPDKDGVEGSRSRTRRLSGRDRQGAFRSTFRLTLDKVERLAKTMIENRIILPTRRINSTIAMQLRWNSTCLERSAFWAMVFRSLSSRCTRTFPKKNIAYSSINSSSTFLSITKSISIFRKMLTSSEVFRKNIVRLVYRVQWALRTLCM